MKLGFGGVLSLTVALACSIYLAASSMETGMSPGGAGGSGRGETSPQTMTVLAEEVALLRTAVTALQRQVQHLARVVTPVSPGSVAASAHDTRRDAPTQREVEHERQKQLELRESHFHHKPAEQQWAVEAAATVEEVLASDATLHSMLLDLECRSQTCRVEFADDESGLLAESLDVALFQLTPVFPRATARYVEDGPGGPTMTIYLSENLSSCPPMAK